MSGTFGYELDLGKLSEEEKAEIREQIQVYHKYSPLIQNGLYYRLTNPTDRDAEVGAWEFVSEDQTEVLFNAVMLQMHGNMTNNYVRLKGLKSGGMYQNTENGTVYPAEALMEVGIPLPIEPGDYQAYQIHLVLI